MSLLEKAARLEIRLSDPPLDGRTLSFEVVVQNVAAGHSLPTSMTELREMWVDLEVIAHDGKVLFWSGHLERDGDIPKGAMRLGTLAGGAEGRVTYKPWEIAQVLSERLVAPKGSVSNTFRVLLPEGFSGRARIEARHLYRSASPRALASLMGDRAFAPRVVEMARAQAPLVVPEGM